MDTAHNITCHRLSIASLRGIHSIDQANVFLPEFLADYNARFAVPPHNPHDAHRPVLHDRASVDLILSIHSTRRLGRNLTLRYRNREYHILGQGKGYRLRSHPVTVCED